MNHGAAGLLTLVALAASCGGPERAPRSATPPVVPAPSAGAVVVVPPAADASAPAGTARDGVVTVSTVAEFLRAIRPNQTLELSPGVYDLEAGPRVVTEYVRWGSVVDGEELWIDGVENLTIRGTGTSRPEILAHPRYAWVMRLVGVKNFSLENVVLGHTKEGYCMGGVLAAERSHDVHVEGSELFGSGTIGVGLDHVEGFHLERSTVRNCSYGIARIDHAAGARFSDARFVENGKYDLVDVSASPGVRFENTTFSHNQVTKGMGHVFFKIDAASSVALDGPTFDGNDFEQLTDRRSRLVVTGERSGGPVQKALAAPSPEFNKIYALASYGRWIVAGTQAGVVFWDPVAGRVDELIDAPMTNHLLVRGRYLWAGGYTATLRFDGRTSKAYLRDARARGESLWLGAGGEIVVRKGLLAQQPNHWWQYDAQRDRFDPIAGTGYQLAPAVLGGGTYQMFHGALVRRNGEAWGVDFLHGLVQTSAGHTTSVPIKGLVYPGRNPRALYEDPRGQLWAIDFDDGFFRYDDGQRTFVHEPTVTSKGADVVVDAQRGRTWLLHYTKGLYLVEPRGVQFFDLSRLEYMRALLLDADGSIWVAGWKALVHLEPPSRGPTQGWSQRDHVVDAATVASAGAP